MNGILIDMLAYMFRHNIIGAKHLPESLLLKSKLKNANKFLQKEFYHDYKILVNQEYFIRLKKQTGKGSEYHISLNPEMLEEICLIIRG